MHLTSLEQNGVTVINVAGELNIETHTLLKKRVRDLVLNDHVRKVIIDMSGIRQIDSTGIGTLVALLNTIRANGGDLRLAGTLAPQVEESINLCGLNRVFTRYPNVKQAIDNFDL